MAGFHINAFAALQLVALGQRFFQGAGRVATAQPVQKHGFLAGIVDAQQIREAGKHGAAVWQGGQGWAEKSQFGGWCIACKSPDHV